MEHALASSQEQMLASLDFSLSASASYVIQRTSSSFYPSGASEMSPAGVKVCRVQLTSESFLDPETIRVQFALANTDAANPVTPKAPWTFFNRIRLLCGGTLLEDVFYANRVNSMMTEFLQPTNFASNEEIQGFAIGNSALPMSVRPGGKYTVNFKPWCLGVLHCQKMWPAFAAGGGLTLELYLADEDECIIPDLYTHSNWKLQQIEVKCDTVLMDSSLENSYKRMLLEGKSLSIGYTTFSTSFQSFVAGTPNLTIPIVKAATRIRGILASFCDRNDPERFDHPDQTDLAAATAAHIVQDSTFSLMVGLGAKRFPIKPIDNLAFFFENLKKVLNIYSTTQGGLNIPSGQYNFDKFIMGVSMERVPGQMFSGISSRMGDLIYLQFAGMPTGAQAIVDRCWVTVITDQIAELSAAGCTVFD